MHVFLLLPYLVKRVVSASVHADYTKDEHKRYVQEMFGIEYKCEDYFLG